MVFPGTDGSPQYISLVALTDVSERTRLCQSHMLRFSAGDTDMSRCKIDKRVGQRLPYRLGKRTSFGA